MVGKAKQKGYFVHRTDKNDSPLFNDNACWIEGLA